MAQTKMAPKSRREQTARIDIPRSLLGQLSDILENADGTEATKDQGKSYWSYSVPMAGVRFYSYQEPPWLPKADHKLNS